MMNRRSWRRCAKSLVATIAAIGCLNLGLALGSPSTAQAAVEKYAANLAKHAHVPGEAVIKVRPGKFVSFAKTIFQLGAVRTFEVFETNDNFFVVKLANKSDLASFLETANKNPNIAYAEPNYIYKIGTTDALTEVAPNDPMFAQLWAMKNTGQTDAAGQVGIAGADISATQAWEQAAGPRESVVAVIDTGVDYNHPDLAANVFRNMGEFGDGKEANGVDDDGNGFIDDHTGWNFAGVSTNNAIDDHSHGTHCSGTIGADANNALGVAGVAHQVRIMPVKFLTAGGSGTLADAGKSIQYATLMRVNLMSNSWGGGGFSQALLDAIVAAKDAGILFVAAAGNDGENADATPHYPSSYEVDNVISVAATDNRDQLASFSNYGKRTVHIAAPGVKILSTVLNGAYGTFSGTSMATPHTSGALAVLWGANLGMNYADIKARLVNSRDPKPQLTRKIMSSGRLNLLNALNGVYPPSNEPAESDWIDGDAMDVIESSHPYVDNSMQEWVVRGPANAKYVRLHFARYDLESNYDFVKISDAQGAEADSVTGTSEGPFNSWYVDGNEARVKFTTDSSVTRFGFVIDKYQYIPYAANAPSSAASKH